MNGSPVVCSFGSIRVVSDLVSGLFFWSGEFVEECEGFVFVEWLIVVGAVGVHDAGGAAVGGVAGTVFDECLCGVCELGDFGVELVAEAEAAVGCVVDECRVRVRVRVSGCGGSVDIVLFDGEFGGGEFCEGVFYCVECSVGAFECFLEGFGEFEPDEVCGDGDGF